MSLKMFLKLQLCLTSVLITGLIQAQINPNLPHPVGNTLETDEPEFAAPAPATLVPKPNPMPATAAFNSPNLGRPKPIPANNDDADLDHPADAPTMKPVITMQPAIKNSATANTKNSTHHPIESFRIDVGQVPAPLKHSKHKNKKSPKADQVKKSTAKDATKPACPACPTCPKTESELIADTTAMGAVIIQDPANGIRGHATQALVVLIPFDSEQLATVSEFTKWLDEQQAENLYKLQTKIEQKAQNLQLLGIKSIIVKKSDVQNYMDQNQVEFADALKRFAEYLGHYARVTAKLSFDDLKAAVLHKLQHS